jgi:hypothetical protein
MALFKKRVSPEEFGGAILYTAENWVERDAFAALATSLEGWTKYDASQRGWGPFLQGKGITNAQLGLFVWLTYHCSLHAVALPLESSTRLRMVRGGMDSFNQTMPSYDFDSVYSALEAFQLSLRRFSPDIESLKTEHGHLTFLPREFQGAGIINARFLLSEFVVPCIRDHESVIRNFEMFSSGVAKVVGVMHSAGAFVSRTVRCDAGRTPEYQEL